MMSITMDIMATMIQTAVQKNNLQFGAEDG